jgi:alcohol dehydrogenase (cytochrome c)
LRVLKSRSSWIVLILLAMCAAAAVAVLRSEALRWRAQVIAIKATGGISDVSWRDLLTMLKPGGPFWLEPLATNPNPYASITNPYGSSTDVSAGAETFKTTCAACHGVDGRGRESAPSLVGRTLTHGDSDWAVYRTVRFGIDGTAMRPHPMPMKAAWQVVAFVHSLTTVHAPQDAASEDIPADFGVPFQSLRDQKVAADDWPTYSGSLNGVRHSTLRQIDATNVARLAPAWIRQFPSPESRGENTPIVDKGVMFVSMPVGQVIAIDAATGKQIWHFAKEPPPEVLTCCGNVNRGVAILDDTVFVGTLDAHVLALSARTGKLLWDTEVEDYRDGYSITSAPLAIDGLVVTGMGGGDYPVRGRIVALDAKTGKKVWEFKTIPEKGETGNDTWKGDSWMKGGTGSWVIGSYDPEQDLLIWGTGNPAPDFSAATRGPGDNLYSCSAVALDARTGKLRWYYQFTPGDVHDWDSSQVPILADRMDGGKLQKEVLWANRNGFFYVLDRTNGKFLRATPFVRQTWAKEIDPVTGRPVMNVDALPSAKGALVFPGPGGGTNWWPSSYDAHQDVFFIPALERGGVFFSTNAPKSTHGQTFLGSATQGVSGLKHYSVVRALDAQTGQLRWEYRLPPRESIGELGGITSTDGGVLFSADLSTFFALDSQSGRKLWSFELGADISAAPVTYEAGGKQFVAVTAGQTVAAFALPAN